MASGCFIHFIHHYHSSFIMIILHHPPSSGIQALITPFCSYNNFGDGTIICVSLCSPPQNALPYTGPFFLLSFPAPSFAGVKPTGQQSFCRKHQLGRSWMDDFVITKIIPLLFTMSFTSIYLGRIQVVIVVVCSSCPTQAKRQRSRMRIWRRKVTLL